MKYDVKFKSIDHSNALVEYVESKFEKLQRFSLRPVTVHVTFSEVRHERKAEVYIKGMQGNFRAQAQSDSFHVCIDMCVKKLERQMEREKSRVKHHRHYEHSNEALLELQIHLEKQEKKAA